MKLISSVAIVFLAIAAVPPSATAQTVNQRLNQLERKTDFYRTKVRTVARKYHRVRALRPAELALSGRAPAAETTCDTQQRLVIVFPTGVVNPAVSNMWLNATINWPLNRPGLDFIDVTLQPQDSTETCGLRFNARGEQTHTLKKFCQQSVDPDQNIILYVRTNDGDACRAITSVDADLKMTNQEMIEPE